MSITVYCDEDKQVRTWYRDCDAEDPTVYTDVGWVRYELPDSLLETFLGLQRNSKLVIVDGTITNLASSPSPKPNGEDIGSPANDPHD